MSTTTETMKSHGNSKTRSGNIGTFIQKVFNVLGCILGIILAILLALPILLLPISTPVPAWIWIPLGILYFVLIILPFRITPAWKGITIGLSGMLLVSILR